MTITPDVQAMLRERIAELEAEERALSETLCRARAAMAPAMARANAALLAWHAKTQQVEAIHALLAEATVNQTVPESAEFSETP